jgi:superfamily II DNA or RNA helicase
MYSFKSIISKVNSWKDFKNTLLPLSKLEKGNAFEELTKYFLLVNPTYSNKLKNVWLQKEVPTSVIKKLNLPSNDQGIDLIAETNDGYFWAIQCKYLQVENTRLSHRAISTFTSLSTGIAKNITYCLVATTADDYAKIYKGNDNIGFINAAEWNKLDKDFFTNVRTILSGKDIKYKPYKPKKHQSKAIREAKKYFINEKNSRGKLVFPCGAGKSLTGYWLKKELKSNNTIIAVPSLSLVKQTLEVYLRETVANKDKIEWLCVCSDEGIGKNDDVAIYTNEIGVPCVTDKTVIANWLITNKNKKTVIFTTYQSGKTIADACKIAKVKFDLGIMDEAHKTVGAKDKLFSHLLFDENIHIDRRIFMTATERRYAGSSDNILSMDDESIYGETFIQMPFKEAISEGILSDYKIISLFISDKEVKEIIQKNAFVKPEGKEWDKETEARTLASLIALRKAMDQFPINHAVTFHSSIKKAEAFEKSQAVFSKAFPKYKKINSFHVSGAMPTSIRSKVVDEFAASQKGIITNAKCLTEGVDVPNIDCVLFADPRKSTVDIVQAVGRALRKKDGKQFGYVILPVFTKSKSKEEIIESEEFKEILSTLRALASNDERIIEFFKDKSRNTGLTSRSNDDLVQFDIDTEIIKSISEKELMNSMQLSVWNKLAKLSWMPFVEARDYARSLGLKNVKEWTLYAKSKRRPVDIPASPQKVYHLEWTSVGDWLGTGFIAPKNREYLSFEKARKIVRSLQLISGSEWVKYCKSNKKPINIPADPKRVYSNEWISMGDWLGTGRVADQYKEYLPFLKAQKIVQAFKFQNREEWLNYCKSGEKPDNIPSFPNQTYRNNGWISMGDWLGNGTIAPKLRKYKPFNQAKNYVHSLGLKNGAEWKHFCKSGKKPNDIPDIPRNTYKNEWNGMGDWLGTGATATFNRKYQEFIKARKYIHSLKLKNTDEWLQYCKSGKKPIDIPAKPRDVYIKNGWINMGDWLGTGFIANGLKEFVSFENAKKIVVTLGLKNKQDWRNYCISGQKPINIPADPQRVYSNEWISMGDWLGTGRVADQNKVYKPFKEAKSFVNKLKLNGQKEWYEYCKSGNKPEDIPRNPNQTYKKKGWLGFGDWLGNGRLATKDREYLPFEKAREYVRNLNLKNTMEWNERFRNKLMPSNIPRAASRIYKNEGWKSWIDFLGME